MKNKTTALTLDQNIAAAVAIMDSLQRDLPNRKIPSLREHIKHSIQALRVLREIRIEALLAR